LRIASGDTEAIDSIAASTERPPSTIQEAAEFYIEQVLLDPASDHYRILGAGPDAPTATLRRHMALLLTWLHPDRNPSGERAVFVARITEAWDTLRNVDKRKAYDAGLTRRRAMAFKGRPSSMDAKSNGAAKPLSPAVIKKRLISSGQSPHRSLTGPLAEERSLLDRGVDYLRKLLRT
jgi:DnaJ-class molecular chaperone